MGGNYDWKATTLGDDQTWVPDGGDADNAAYISYRQKNGTTWSTFADLPTGLYTFTLPYDDAGNIVVEGTKPVVYYDKNRWLAAFKGSTAEIFIDQLGGVWKGNPESGGEFVCGPYEGTAYVVFKDKVADVESKIGIPNWDASATYTQGDIVVYNYRIYESLQSSNTNNAPSGWGTASSNLSACPR